MKYSMVICATQSTPSFCQPLVMIHPGTAAANSSIGIREMARVLYSAFLMVVVL